MSNDTDKTDRARLVFEAAERLGWSDADEVAKFVRRLERGLPAEDEFSVVLRWLGQCRLVHKLDQFPYPPGVWSRYRVPDLLAVFEVDGQAVPALIEVKVNADPVLSWKPAYLAALQRYAELLRLPLLVAWKHGTIWVLFEARHLRKAAKNLNISFGDALKETLLGLLAGDFSFSFRPGVGLHLKIRKVKEHDDRSFEGKVEEAYLLNARGEKHKGGGGILQLFTCIQQDVELQEDETHVVQSFIVPANNSSEPAHRALVTLLEIFRGKEPLVWRHVLLKEQRPWLSVSPQQAARNGLEAGFIQYVLQIEPTTPPSFIRPKADGG